MKSKPNFIKCTHYWLPVLLLPIPTTTKGLILHIRVWFPIECMHCAQRKAGCLLLLQAFKISAEQNSNRERKVLSIVATLEEFQGILLGSDIHVLLTIKLFTWQLKNTMGFGLAKQDRVVLLNLALYWVPYNIWLILYVGPIAWIHQLRL